MKTSKIVFIIFLLLFNHSIIMGQPYISLLGTSNQWNISGGFEDCRTFISYTNGDTVISTKTYSRLFCPSCGLSNDTVLVALLREDTSLRKVFMKRFQYPNLLDTNEFVYYDFSLTAG